MLPINVKALLYIENNVLEEKITKIDGEAITLR